MGEHSRIPYACRLVPFRRVPTRVMGEAFDTACAELQDSNLSELVAR